MSMKSMKWLAPVLALLLLGSGLSRAGEKPVVRFGITAVVVRENLRFFDRFAGYLSTKLGREVRFVRRKTYQEIMNLLDRQELEIAWICGYPFVQKRNASYISLLVVPVYQGKQSYRSYIIAHKNSRIDSIVDLRDKVFAYSDPDSNSGYLYPTFLLHSMGFESGDYFRNTFFTYNHAETVEAVAERVADGGAVDSYIWDFLRKANPALTLKTKIIHRSPEFGFPPIVARKTLPAALKGKVRTVLAKMHADAQGRKLLDALMLDGFTAASPGIYASIRNMHDELNSGRKTGLAKSGLEIVGRR